LKIASLYGLAAKGLSGVFVF
jgi:hypothetical protein